jgi:hypothetical protein
MSTSYGFLDASQGTCSNPKLRDSFLTVSETRWDECTWQVTRPRRLGFLAYATVAAVAAVAAAVSLRGPASTPSFFWTSPVDSRDSPAQEQDKNPSLGPE